VGSEEVSHKVLDALKEAGIEAKGVKRGLDHGVWASFKCGESYKIEPIDTLRGSY
jgi:aromatic ring-opening dioxygenase catalytic subunit (LigB family)